MRHDLTSLAEREVMPGFFGRFIHTDATTHAYWRIEAGAVLRPHAHPHEQVVNLFEGELELTVEGVPHRLGPGSVLVIAGNQVHSGHAITACRVLDVFSPVRDDYR